MSEELTFRDVYIRAGYNQTTLARKTGLSRMTIWKMNAKKGDIWFSSVQRACHEVGISLDYYASLAPCADADKFKP